MASVTLTDVVAHTLADAGVVNNNNASLRAAINGGIDNANVSPSAGIQPSKLQLPGGVTTFLRGDGTFAAPTQGDLAYVPFTTAVNITATSSSGATQIVSAGSFVADGTSAYWVEFFCPSVIPHNQGRHLTFTCWEGTNDLGTMGVVANVISSTTVNMVVPVLLKHRFIPGSGSRTYSIRGWMTDGSGTSVADGTGGLGGYIRVFKG